MSGKGTVACDWDGTLVDPATQEWLPGGLMALKQMLVQYRRVLIHTSRANWAEGRAQIEAKLEQALTKPGRVMYGDQLQVVPKPLADVYVDNKALRFEGDWGRTLIRAREVASSC